MQRSPLKEDALALAAFNHMGCAASTVSLDGLGLYEEKAVKLRYASKDVIRPPSKGEPAALWVHSTGLRGAEWCDPDIWQPYNEDFVGFDSLEDMCMRGDVALLRGRWLYDQAFQFKDCDQRQALPRRQDIPEEAFWNPAEVIRISKGLWNAKAKPFIVAVSHCWQTEQHPDPQGLNLKILGAAANSYMKTFSGINDIAIFIDWCCLYQPDNQEDRSFEYREEEASFLRASGRISTWYACKATMKWMLTNVSEKRHAGDLYLSRGWPFFEQALSSMFTEGSHVLDLGRLRSHEVAVLVYGEDRLQSKHSSANRQSLVQQQMAKLREELDNLTWPCLVKRYRLRRHVPEPPESFIPVLKTKRFGHASDLAMLEHLYLEADRKSVV